MFLSQLREGLNSLGVAKAAAVRVLAFLLDGDAKSFYDSVTMTGTRSQNTNRTCTWPYVVHSLIDRYLTGTELQDAYDGVTLIAQSQNENENDYADKIAAAARHCANVFEDDGLVHYYVRGLLARTRERVSEDRRRLPEKERNNLPAIRRHATAQVNTYRAQVQAAENTKAHTRARPRTQTLYVAPDPRETRGATGPSRTQSEYMAEECLTSGELCAKWLCNGALGRFASKMEK